MAGEEDLVTSHGLHVPGDRDPVVGEPFPGAPVASTPNTSDTQVTVELDLDAAELPGGVTERLRTAHGDTVRATSSDSRSQYRNRQLARKRLADVVDGAAKPPARRRPTKPTRGAQRRRLEEKRQHSEKKARRSWRPER